MTEFYEPSSGPRFSQLYLEWSAPTQDSVRMRRRLARLFDEIKAGVPDINFVSSFERWTGANILYGKYGYLWPSFFETAELRDIFDLVTLVVVDLSKFRGPFKVAPNQLISIWEQGVSNILVEENVAYRLGEDGVVRPAIDEEHQRARSSLIRGLSALGLESVAADISVAYEELEDEKPNPSGAIRHIFLGVEGYIRLVFPRVPRLTEKAVNSKIVPAMQQRVTADPAAETLREQAGRNIQGMDRGRPFLSACAGD